MDEPDRLRPQVRLALASLSANPLASTSDPTARFLTELDRYLASLGGGADNATAAPPFLDAGTTGGSWSPLAIEAADVETASAGPRNAFEISFPQAVVWALIACVATFAASIVRERSQGTLVRLLTAPLSAAHIIGGKALSCFAASVGLALALIMMGVLFFDLHPTSPTLLALALMSAAVALVGLMMLLSVVGKTERSTSGSAWAILMIMAMFGGGMMPLTFMPDWMVRLSHLSPIKWAILAMEGGLWRDFDLAEMALPCGILLAIGATAFALGARSLHAKLA
jgi:ABC-2 type transport system permease protein